MKDYVIETRWNAGTIDDYTPERRIVNHVREAVNRLFFASKNVSL